MSDARQALLEAIYQTLVGDEALIAMLPAGRIFNTPVRGTAFPFVSLDRIQTLGGNDDGVTLRRQFFEIVVYGRNNRREVSAIADRIVTILDETTPDVTGGTIIWMNHNDTVVQSSSDQLSFWARIRMRCLLEEQN